jgi:hypothetical protein
MPARDPRWESDLIAAGSRPKENNCFGLTGVIGYGRILMAAYGKELGVRTHRLLDRPIISAELHPTIGANIQGPSMIRVPEWIDGRLGDYYLYFADHKGGYIRLAYADHPTGPWTIYAPGSLQLAQSRFLTEPPVASPDQVALFEARWKQRGALMSHDILSEITTPHIASPLNEVTGTSHDSRRKRP